MKWLNQAYALRANVLRSYGYGVFEAIERANISISALYLVGVSPCSYVQSCDPDNGRHNDLARLALSASSSLSASRAVSVCSQAAARTVTRNVKRPAIDAAIYSGVSLLSEVASILLSRAGWS